MRSRPRAAIEAPRRALPGDVLDVELALDFSGRTPVDAIRLRLVGIERHTRIPEHFPPDPFAISLRREVVLSGKDEIAPGRRSYRASFGIPSDAPSSYRGRLLVIEYYLVAEVVIPWWPNLLERQEVVVEARPAPRPVRSPLSRTRARDDGKLFFEITLDDQILSPGDVLSGALALGNLRGRRLRELSMSLFARESTAFSRDILSGADIARTIVFPFQPDLTEEGRELPFRWSLPGDLPPSFHTDSASLHWVLQVLATVAGGAEVSLKIPVVVRALDRPSELTAARPRVGTERLRLVWAHAGVARGLGLDPVSLALSGEIEGLRASVCPDPKSSEPVLTARLDHASWGLDLRVRLRRPGIFALGSDDFNGRARVGGRDPAQVDAALTGAVRRALSAFDEADLDDHHAEVRAYAGSYDQPQLGQLLDGLAALAAAMRRAIAATPPPPPMAALLPAWRAFAEDLRGELAVGSMAIRGGALDGARLDVETVFGRNAVPERTRVILILDPPLKSSFDPADHDAMAGAPPGVREIAVELLGAARALRVDPRQMEMDTPAPVIDPATLRDGIGKMLTLARLLRGDSGGSPYR